MHDIDLPFWEPKKVPVTAMVNIVGARGSGKTTLVKRYLFERRNDYEGSIVMCGSSDGKKAYSKCIPPASIMKASKTTLKEKLGAIQKVLDRQNEIAEMYPDGKDDPRVRPVLMLWDDVMFLSSSLMNHGTTLEFYSNGRHAKTGSINAVQYVNQLPPFARDQSEILIIMGKDIAPEMIEKLHKYWFRKYFTLEELTETLDMLTKMRMALVWDKTQSGVFVFDADPEGKQPGNDPVPYTFTFGSTAHHYSAWRYAKRQARPNEIRARIAAKNAMEFKPEQKYTGEEDVAPAAPAPAPAPAPARIRIQGRDGRTVIASAAETSATGHRRHHPGMPSISEVAPVRYGGSRGSGYVAAPPPPPSSRHPSHSHLDSKVAKLAAYLDAGTTAIGGHSLASHHPV